MLKPYILKTLRKKGIQFFWEKLYHYSRIGMNFGGGNNTEESGERYALKYANSIFGKTKNETAIIFDVGANVGQFAFMANELFQQKKLIYSFEPSKFTFDNLKTKINLENLQDVIKPMNIGLDSKSEKRTLYSSGRNSTVASLYNLENCAYPFKDEFSEDVILTTIDDFCEEFKIEKIDYLKLDIEGHEYKALLGAKRTLNKKCIKFIQFEFGQCNIDSKTYFRDFYNLLAPAYKLYRIVSNGLVPIRKYSTESEVFDTINYLAELND